ncbi:MAG TPA: FtsX-like permease family protein [Rubricoccaceae bacterium]
MPFLTTLAWRDSRGARSRLVLYVSAMALGVAALVAIRSFGVNLERAVDEQARDVFGSDLQVRRSASFTAANEALLDSLARETRAVVLREATFPSMARFPAAAGGEGRARLGQVRALDGPFPLYGRATTTPEDAFERFQASGGALVDATLMLQMDAEVGDSVQVGGRSYPIVGRVDAVPGQTDVAALVGPRVYVPLAGLDSTLLGFGSRARFIAALRFPGEAEVALASVVPRLDRAGLRYDTAGEDQEQINEASGYLTRFLSLVGFVALLLGGVGVASSISVYVSEKAESVATLRCLGLPSRRVLAVYAMQAVALGLVGAAVGALLGVAVQRLLPVVLSGFLPVTVSNAVVPRALVEGVGVGLVASVLFAMWPLAGVRRVPPLRAIRADAEARGLDVLQLGVGLLLVAAVAGFAFLQTRDVQATAGFVGGTAAVFALLALASVGIRGVVRRLAPRGMPWAWRQGLANLHAPGNQTLVLTVTLGLGVFLVLALALVQASVLSRIALPGSGGAAGPDVVLFDVQPDQRDSLRTLVAGQGLSVLGEVPIVQMRIAALDGVRTDSLLADTAATSSGRPDDRTGGPPRWALAREYRSTYRDALVPTETVTAGRFEGTVDSAAPVVPVSVEADLATDLGIGIGSAITWDVGGVEVETRVTSLRKVDWAQVQPNFFVVFPAGPLDAAPQTAVVLTRAGTAEASARLQSAVVETFPNVSAVDVRLVLELLDGVLGRVADVLRFMALFAVITGLVVLAGAVRVALAQRTREAVLLRTMGASRAQVRRTLVAEYALLGALGALTGGALAVGGAYALARFAFDIPFVLDPTWLLVALVAVPAMTAAVGLAGSRAALSRPPLDVLRAEE